MRSPKWLRMNENGASFEWREDYPSTAPPVHIINEIADVNRAFHDVQQRGRWDDRVGNIQLRRIHAGAFERPYRPRNEPIGVSCRRAKRQFS